MNHYRHVHIRQHGPYGQQIDKTDQSNKHAQTAALINSAKTNTNEYHKIHITRYLTLSEPPTAVHDSEHLCTAVAT